MTSSSTIVVGDITINTTSTRNDVANTTSSDGNIGGRRDDLMQFAERYFTDLSADGLAPADEFEPSLHHLAAEVPRHRHLCR